MNDSPLPRRYRFGVFEVDRVTGDLRRAGARVRLQGKPFDLLMALLDARGDLVTREALQQQLWPGTIVDFEGSLNAAMRRLRDAIKDSAESPAYIETVPRRGYRVLVPVEPLEAAGHERTAVATGAGEPAAASGAAAEHLRSTQEPPADPPKPPRSRRRFLAGFALGLSLVAVAASVFAVIVKVQRPESNGRQRLLVLPFENLSRDPDETWFSDGLTEEMIARIGAMHPERLGVIARTSAMQYRKTDDPIEQARRLLGIDYVLEGSVRRDSGRVRVNATLIQTLDQTTLWTETFDRDMRDVLALQADIAQRVADALALELLPDRAASLSGSKQVDPEAFEAVLRGRYQWAQQTGEGFRAAGESYRRAIAIDPTYAPAWAGVADAYALVGIYDFMRPDDAFPRAREAALMAIDLDANLAEAHASLALIQGAYDWDWDAAEQSIQRAIELNPAYAPARHWYGMFLDARGRHDEALAELEAARQLDPLSRIIQSDIGWHMFYSRKFDQAERQLQATLDLDPNFLVAHDNLAWVYFEKGEYDRYIEHSVRALSLAGDSQDDLRRYREFYAREGWRALRRRSADNMAREAAHRYVSPYDIALEYAAVGAVDDGLQWLQRALEQREVDMIAVRVDPRLDALRTDSRFEAIAEQVRPRVPKPAGR